MSLLIVFSRKFLGALKILIYGKPVRTISNPVRRCRCTHVNRKMACLSVNFAKLLTGINKVVNCKTG